MRSTDLQCSRYQLIGISKPLLLFFCAVTSGKQDVNTGLQVALSDSLTVGGAAHRSVTGSDGHAVLKNKKQNLSPNMLSAAGYAGLDQVFFKKNTRYRTPQPPGNFSLSGLGFL